MSLIPREHQGPEDEDSGPVGGKRGSSFGDVKAPTGSFTQEDSGPESRGGGTDGLVPVTNAYNTEESMPSRASKSGRVDEVKGDV